MEKLITLIVAAVLCLSLVACNTPENTQLCADCLASLTGEWYTVSEDGVLSKAVFNENSTMLLNEKEYTLSGNCKENEHHIYIKDFESVYYVSGSSELQIGSTKYLRNENYNFVEITNENWQQYFAEDYYVNFVIAYDLILQEETNTAGESVVKSYGVKKEAVLIGTSQFAPFTTLILEHSQGQANERATIDTEKKILKNVELCEEPLYADKETKLAYLPGDSGSTAFIVDLGLDNSNPLASEIVVNLETPGEMIHSIRGWLVLKSEMA